MTDAHKYYAGIIIFFILIALYLLNFLRGITDISNPDTLVSEWFPNFIVLFGAFVTAILFVSFYKGTGLKSMGSENSPKILGGTVITLLGLFIGGLFANHIGAKNNTSLLSSLFYFVMIFAVVGLWKKEADAGGTANANPEKTMLEASQVKYLGIFLAYLLLLFVLYATNPGGIMTKFVGATVFVTMFVGLLLLGMVLGYSALTNQLGTGSINIFNPWLKGLYIFLSLFVSGLLFWWILTAFGVFANDADQHIGSMIFNFVLLLGVLTLVYKVSYLGGWFANSPFIRLLINSFLYIPCLFSGILDKLRGIKTPAGTNPFQGTKSSDVIALFVVLIIIALYFILVQWIIPGLKKWYYLKGGKQIIGGATPINKKSTASSFVELNDIPEDQIPTELNPSYRYGISFWLYVDSFPPSTSSAYSKHSTILDYGGVPLVKYYAATNTMGVYIRNMAYDGVARDKKDERLLYSHDGVALQKWNNVVINYLNGTMDIFYNGRLVSSSIEVSPPIVYDTLTVGMDDGISGDIANVVYYADPLSLYSINTLYNSLKNTSPPLG